MNPMTEFQMKAVPETERLLASYGVPGRMVAVPSRGDADLNVSEGDPYFVISFSLGGQDYEAFIYDDEAGYSVGGEWKPFEAPDYSDSGSLMRAFLDSLKGAIDRCLHRADEKRL